MASRGVVNRFVSKLVHQEGHQGVASRGGINRVHQQGASTHRVKGCHQQVSPSALTPSGGCANNRLRSSYARVFGSLFPSCIVGFGCLANGVLCNVCERARGASWLQNRAVRHTALGRNLLCKVFTLVQRQRTFATPLTTLPESFWQNLFCGEQLDNAWLTTVARAKVQSSLQRACAQKGLALTDALSKKLGFGSKRVPTNMCCGHILRH